MSPKYMVLAFNTTGSHRDLDMGDIQQDLTRVSLQMTLQELALDESLMRNLTREIALDMRELPDVLQSFGVSTEQWLQLCARPAFMTMLRDQIALWSGSMKTEDRIKLKMMHMVEESLPELHKELIKDGLSTAKVELVKTLMKGGGLGLDSKQGDVAERVNIVINMGAEKTVSVSQPLTIDHDAEEAA